jgi:hypothetical protein
VGQGRPRLASLWAGYDNVKAIFREVTDLIGGNRARYEIRGNAEYDTPAGRTMFPVSVMR